MKVFNYALLALLLCASSLLLSSCSKEEDETRINIGHFPNVTHIQALVARNMSREGEGWFERYFPNHSIHWMMYTAGPTAMEAMFSRTIDLCYVGPSPAINAFAASQGEELRVLSGAVKGGSALVVGEDSGIEKASDFKGKRVATPQLGNTQDVACRAWMTEHDISNTLDGKGEVSILPTSNSMQLFLLDRGEIDASFTVEPWLSQLVSSADGRIFFEDKEAVTTLLAVRKKWLDREPELAATFARAHEELTSWIIANPEEAQRRVIEELSMLMQSPIDPAIIKSAWARLQADTAIDLDALAEFVKDAKEAEILENVADINTIIAQPSTTAENHAS